MGTRCRRIGSVGLLSVVLSAGLLWSAQPVGAAGTPPVIALFNVWAENRPTFTTGPHLHIEMWLDDPDGQVPRTIQSVIVTKPDSSTIDLTRRFAFPNLGFRGEYFLDAGTPVPTGTYTVTVTDIQGNIVTATDTLNSFPILSPPNITFPSPDQILTTPTPTFTWDAVTGAMAVRVRICNADPTSTNADPTSTPPNCGDTLYSSQFLPGTATAFTLPSGVLEPGRRYALWLVAFDMSTGLPTANIRVTSIRNFSVAGPKVSLFLNQSAFRTGDTLHLGVNLRNDSPTPVPVHVRLWAGAPTIPDPIPLIDADVTIPATSPDMSLVVNDIFVVTFTAGFPAGTYVLGIRFLAGKTDGVMAQSMVSFSFAP